MLDNLTSVGLPWFVSAMIQHTPPEQQASWIPRTLSLNAESEIEAPGPVGAKEDAVAAILRAV